jgi:predicted secreted protein
MTVQKFLCMWCLGVFVFLSGCDLFEIEPSDENDNGNDDETTVYHNLPLYPQNGEYVFSYSKHEYYFRLEVMAGETYIIGWQDRYDKSAEASCTAGLVITASHENGSLIFEDAHDGYSNPRSFTPAVNETITIKVHDYNYTGTATVYYLPASAVPSNLGISSANANAVSLAWTGAAGASGYRVYRSLDRTNGFILAGTASGNSFTDDTVSTGTGYYYRVVPLISGKEGLPSGTVFSVATAFWNLPLHTAKQAVNMTSGAKHYYRLAVTAGTSYAIEWQTGWYNDGGTVTSDSGAANSLYVTAWQNDGAGIFTDQSNGFTSPKTFTAGSSGYVTVEVRQYGSFTGTYAIYYFNNGSVNTGDGSGTLPPVAPGNLKVFSPATAALGLSWNTVSGASLYRVFRANSANGAYSLVGTSAGGTSYTDASVTGGMSYYYKVSAISSGGESPQSGAAFGFAAAYYELSHHTSKQIVNMTSGAKHYYRLAVTAGTSYTIEWQTGWYNDGGTVTSDSGAANSVYVTAWQNDGAGIFTDQSNGFTSPKTFTAGSSGYVTVEVRQYGSFTGTYAVYYYQN